MEAVLYERFGRWGLGADRDRTLPIIGAVVDGKPNFMAAAWVSRVNFKRDLRRVHARVLSGAPPEVLPAMYDRVIGAVAIGINPTIFASYSTDGITYSQERGISAGKTGDRNKRLTWMRNGRMADWRTYRFRGTSDAHLSMARLEARLEPLVW